MMSRTAPLACRRCRRALDPHELVYVSSLWPYQSWRATGHVARVTCAPCEERDAAGSAERHHWPARPCLVCGRPTRRDRSSRAREPRVCCCSTPCLSTYIREQQRRRRPPIEPRDCVACQQPFTPRWRAGAYCSSACRQRAYRQQT
jgi:hypothetical protein